MEESQIRILRDVVFEVPSSEKNWQACKENWSNPNSIEWLRTQLDLMGSKPTKFWCRTWLNQTTKS